jgi:competence protein ComEC
MRWLILAFVAGAAWLQTRPALPALAWLWLLPPALAVLPWLPRGGQGRPARRALLLGLAVMSGFFYAAWRAELRLAEQLASAWEGRDLAVIGRVAGLPEHTPRGIRFSFRPERGTPAQAEVPGLVQLNLYARAGEVLPRLAGGDCLALQARLYRPHGSLNPGGFDYEGWLLQRGIRATGQVTAPPRPARGCGGRPQAALDQAREAVRGRLQAALSGQPYAGVVVALAVGDQNAIPDSQWALFRTTGVTHLMSISGLHVTLFSTLVFLAVQALWRRQPGLVQRLPARPVAAGLGLASAAAYVALAGFGLPAQRTLFMLATVGIALATGRLHSPAQILAAALAAVVLIDPWAALAPGFWLSFGAVAALLYGGAGRLGQGGLWRHWLHAQWAVSLALLPALLMIFHEVSLVSPLANAFAIPLISLLAVPLVLAGALLPWDGLIQAAHAVVQLTMAALAWLAALPQPVFHAATPTGAALVLAGLAVLVLLLPRGVPGRWLGIVLLLPLLLPRLDRPVQGAAWVTMLDVGQGLAVLVQTTDHALLYDTGPRYASGEDAGLRVVAPFLHAQGLNRLDGLVVSHDDSDHAGGAVALVQSHRPSWLLTSIAGQLQPSPGATGRALLAAAPASLACAAGQHWIWDGVSFEVLHPPAHHYRNPNFGDNDRSCIVRIASRQGSLLLTGDMARLAELSLLEAYPATRLHSDLLVVPHHGSASSSMPELMTAVAPSLALLSVGRRNAYGHPAPEVLERYRNAGVEILRSDRQGAVLVRLDPGGRQVATARALGRRYWHDR